MAGPTEPVISYEGNLTIDSNVYKYGNGSASLDGAVDTFLQDDVKNTLYAFDDNDYTISLWVYYKGRAQTTDNQYLFDFRTKESDTAPVLYLPIDSNVPHFHNTAPPTVANGFDSDGEQIIDPDDNNALIVGNTGLNDTPDSDGNYTWHHIAVSRKGTTTKLFLDGNKIGEIEQETKDFFGAKKNIKVGSGLFSNLDDVFVAKNIGLYDVDFVAPSREQGNIPQTSLLLTFPSGSSDPVVSTGTENESEPAVDIGSILAGAAVIGEITGAVDVCGASGIVSNITEGQKQINQLLTEGKNAIAAVKSKVDEAKTFVKTLKEKPEVIKRTLQQDLFNILSEESLKDPNGLPNKILEVRDAYQDAAGASSRIMDNVEQFIRDPLNTPLSICDDIPNITKLGDAVSDLANNSKMPDFSAVPENIIAAVTEEFNEILPRSAGTSEEAIQSGAPEVAVKTAPRFPLPDTGANMARCGRVSVQQAFNPGPGMATTASRAGANGTAGSDVATIPPTTINNPFPDGRQFTPAEFEPSRYKRRIAERINTLDPSVRGIFASAVIDYLENNAQDGRDINVTEGYRSPERSAQLAASGIRAAGAGRSWHNYGAAMDVAIYVNGRYDDGTRGVAEYTGRWRTSLQKFGLINDLSGDTGHAYIASLGAAVPRALREGQTTVAALTGGASSGLA